jgi:hypothetical protein
VGRAGGFGQQGRLAEGHAGLWSNGSQALRVMANAENQVLELLDLSGCTGTCSIS